MRTKEFLRSDFSKIFFLVTLALVFYDCRKAEERFYTEADRTIEISDNLVVDNGFVVRDPIFNFNTYDNFLSYISSSNHFLIVPQQDFESTQSSEKVILSLRYDMDEDMKAAIKFAYREHKYGIKSSYFVLHTADYYGIRNGASFIRNEDVVPCLKKIQDYFGHEIGFHNDLITLQVVYGVLPGEYLRNELAYLRVNGIKVYGTTYHGSKYCYKYQYYNAYFWKEYPDGGWNYEYVSKGNKNIKIAKDSLNVYDFEYEGGLLKTDYFFTDVNYVNGKRWNMNMVNFDTIMPGKKVIILLHPALWN